MTETVRQPKQQRSRDSAQRVLEAGKELLEELGFEGFTIQQVSERAGFSVGAIYARFGSKENLVRAVHQHAMGEIADMTAVLEPGEWTKLAPEQFVCEAVRRVAELFRVHRKFLRASMHLGAIDETVAERGSEGSQMAARTFRSLVVSVLDGRDRARRPGARRRRVLPDGLLDACAPGDVRPDIRVRPPDRVGRPRAAAR